jgi:ATP-dependent DNA helicase HFM1/MER3
MAKRWLRKTLLFRRIQKNPAHYNLDMGSTASWEECVDSLVTKSLNALRETQLVKDGKGENELVLTEFGDIMSVSTIIARLIGRLLIEFC